MESLLFLLVALGIIALGTTVVLLRAREPKGEYHGIKSFQREMQALSPDGSRTTMAAEGVDPPVGLDPLLAEAMTTSPLAEEIDPQPAERQE